MWHYLYRLWRSGLVDPPKRESPEPPAGDASREALHEDQRQLLEEKERLQRAASSYREFGYDDLAGRIRERLLTVARRITAIRLHLRRRTAATGR